LQPDIGTGIIVAFAAAAVALALASLQWLGQTALIMLLTMMGAAILCGTIGLIISAEKEFRVGRSWKRKVALLTVTTMSVCFCVSGAYFVTLAWRSSPANIKRTAQISRDAGIQVMTTRVVDYGPELAEAPGMMYLSALARKQWGIDDGSAKRQSFIRRLLSPHLLWFQLQIVRHLFDAGVPLIAGTDAFGFPGIAPGISLQKELEILREAGLPPYDVLRTVTVNPAALLGKSQEFGQVVSRQRADLLLVDGNPLQDLSVLRKPEGVMIRGRWLSASDLQKMLDGLPK
jgi:hypothetical protein